MHVCAGRLVIGWPGRQAHARGRLGNGGGTQGETEQETEKGVCLGVIICGRCGAGFGKL